MDKTCATDQGASLPSLPEVCLEATEPQVFKGLVSEWPVVRNSALSDKHVSDYLLSFYQGAPVTVYEAPLSADGRIFYNDDFSDFNFQRLRKPLDQVLQQLLTPASGLTQYVGSTAIKHWLPNFEQANALDMRGLECLNSVWLGNQSVIAPHFDFPSNLACVVAGRRRFTLFPPDQLENLYIGPMDLTPSGQPISLVDVRKPDYDKFPKYRKAQEVALVFELEAGDALFIPSMWWHSVESLGTLNVLVNYWWRQTPAYLGSPLAALYHALLSFNQLPEEQRKVWGNLFQHFVFERDEQSISHLPESLKKLYSAMDEQTARSIKSGLRDMLKQ